jgi:hypothetical protein
MPDLPRLSLVLILAACSRETTAVDDTAGSTTSPGGEAGDENSSSTTDENPTTMGSEDESPTTMESEDDGFVPHLDGPVVDFCDPFTQDCPNGEKCVPYSTTGGSWNANKCVPILGDGQSGEACTYDGTAEATDSCDASSHCWDVLEVDGQAVGTCAPFCKGTPDDPICAEGTSCLIANQGSITLCIATCDPVAQDCPEGLACIWINNGFNCVFTSQEGPQQGDPCDMIASCGPGLACLSAEVLPECAVSACCGKFCWVSDADPDPVCDWEGTECVPYFEPGEEPEGYEDVGVCIVPPP